MKKMTLVILSTLTLALAAPAAFSEEKPATEKNLCILYGQECANRADTIQEKIRKLQTEIEKGARVYSPEELERLKQKLDEVEEMLYDIEYLPSRHRK
jgi:Skp family chaperone for outer membrane proteins